MLIKKAKQYKHMIGKAIRLTEQNNELLQRLISDVGQLERQAGLLQSVITDIGQLERQVKLQNEIAAVNTAAFAEYKNINYGKDVVIVATGPSLNKYKPLENAIHIGVNNAYSYNDIKLDYWFLQDKYAVIDIEKLSEKVKCKKFIGLKASKATFDCELSESFCLKYNASRYFTNVASTSDIDIPLDIRFHPLINIYTVVFPALHFALFTNPKRIYIVGCDTSYNGYFNETIHSSREEDMRISLNGRLNGFRCMKEHANKWYPETEIISVNPLNLKGLFHDMYTDENGVLVEKTDNKNSPVQDWSEAGISSFVDKHVEQLLNG